MRETLAAFLFVVIVLILWRPEQTGTEIGETYAKFMEAFNEQQPRPR